MPGGLPAPSAYPPPPPTSTRRPRRAWPAVVALVAGLIGGVGGVLAGVWIADRDETSSGEWRRPSTQPISVEEGRPDEDLLARLDVASVVSTMQNSVVTVFADVDGPDGQGTSTGTGVVLTSDGEVITNAHVVADATEVRVRLPGESEPRSAVVLATDPGNDLALVKVEATGLVPATFASDGSLRLGDEVVAIGYALDLDGGPSVTLGIVSGLDRTITTDAGALDRLVQTDAAISSGNSGGPLVNGLGEVVGINTAVARGDTTTAANNIGFAIAAPEAVRVIDQLRASAGGEARTEGYLGVGLADRLDGGGGVIVTEVAQGSPADVAGIEVDDVIVAVDGSAVEGQAALIAAIRDAMPGDDVELGILRDGEELTVTATLVERPES